ncbi:fasciclin domain-containing protein [Maribacter sp. PR1]|uniref:Fasciclin domain-containing protein n=1 Tax=Maribacter cobaltidurans TaxID=1178778 RepID=A0ABU7IWS1_9FLAO|nr:MULTISPECIES: fasciclin domain-containing protein [Maribacter]MDC6390016.1 fasciclin domain-containing protein [Maribacter sp. PR1]MEE1977406.1 fasciclin domain-containing protein [Maribacter cobaltidurans]
METFKTFLKPTIFLLMVALVVSCSDDDDGGPQMMDNDNIVETAQATGSLSTLVSALTKADESANNDLITTLSNEKVDFTVLAPSNDAFTSLLNRLDGFDSLDDFNSEQLQDLLATILTYHVVSGAAVTSDQLTAGQTIATVQGENLTVSLEGGVSFIDAAGEMASVTTADVQTENGVVHIIDKVLIPQAALDALSDVLLSSITDLAISVPDLSILVDALVAADGDLPDVLATGGPYTVFAPTNAAFEAFLEENNFASLDAVPVPVLTQVLLNHVVSGTNLSTDLTTSYVSSLSTAGPNDSNLSLFINTESGVVINGVSEVTSADNKAINGVVHIVNEVIGLPNIVDHAVANPDLSSLVGALTTDGNTTFTDLLSDPETDFTVFAPSNMAFESFMNPDANDLNSILSNHVISGTAADSGSLTNMYVNSLATNADGDNLSLYINVDDGVQINGTSTVAAADIVATNGIIHAVDTVIDLPTVVTFATADPNFSSLVGALTSEGQPDFVSVLSTSGEAPAPFTVFAPVNDAFAALSEVPSGDVLTAVLNHHVIAEANIVSGDLSDGLVSPATLEGDTLTFSIDSESNVTITDGSGNTDIGIIAVDVQANNGVIHAINKVMIPDTNN